MGVWHVASVFDDAPWARLKTIDNFGIVCARHPNCHHARCLDRVSGKLLASACMAPVKVECRHHSRANRHVNLVVVETLTRLTLDKGAWALGSIALALGS